LTATQTDTPTVTLTPTVTNTATNTSTFTPTGSETATYTATYTASSTSTKTATPTITATATTTSTTTPDPYRLTGTVRYSGTAVSPTGKYIYILADTDPTFQGQFAAMTMVSASSSAVSYTLNLPSAGTYYILTMIDPTIMTSNFNPGAGDPYAAYNGQCLGGTPTSIVVSAPTTKDLTFADTCILGGVHGTINYSGCLAVNNSSPIHLQFYTDIGYSTPVDGGKADITTASGTYSAAIPSSATSAYAQVYLDSNSDGSLSTCEPYENLGLVQINPASTLNINFGGSLYNCSSTAAFTGTVSTTVGAISATHPVIVRAYYYNTNYWQMGGMTSVACAGGSYSLPVTTGSGQYVLTAEYCSNTTGSGQNNNQNPSVGNYYSTTGDVENFNNATQITYSGTTKTVNLNADKFQVLGYTGSVTYTGSKTLKDVCSQSNGPQIEIGVFDIGTENPIQSTGLQGNFNCGSSATQGTYSVLTNYYGATSSTYALKVFYDANGDWNLDSGDSYYDMGTYVPNAGSPVYNATVGDSDLTPVP
jgi:hypothetical protein